MSTSEWVWLGLSALALLVIASLKDSPLPTSSLDDDLRSSYPPSEDAMNYLLPGSFESSPRR